MTSRPISLSASTTAFAIIWVKRVMARMASSFPGMGKSIPSGLQLVSTMAIMGIPILLASATAIASFLVSMINTAPGISFISLIPPRFFSSFARSLFSFETSFFVRLSKVPSTSILSIFFSRITDFLIVVKLVSMPPSHRLLTKNIPHLCASRSTACWACFFVPTKRMDLLSKTIFRTSS